MFDVRTFRGCATALVTPMNDDMSLDEGAFIRHVHEQITQGVDGLVPVGTTGESPTLSHKEHERIIELCIRESAGRVPVIAGAGSNSTEEACHLSRHAESAGADAVLIVTPYYNKPNQEGLYHHYKRIAESVSIPIIIYNIPSRSIIEMTVETIVRLAEDFTNIVGVKDADSLNLPRVTEIHRALGDAFVQLSGDDATVPAFLAQGGHGAISVMSNVAPAQTSEMIRAWFAHDLPRFANLRNQLLPLGGILFAEPSPSPVKYAMSRLGFCGSSVRLPLVSCTKSTRDAIDSILSELLNLSD